MVSLHPLLGKVCLPGLRIQGEGKHPATERPRGTADQHGKAVWNLLRNKTRAGKSDCRMRLGKPHCLSSAQEGNPPKSLKC